jgi:hypothetical protein
VHPISRPGISVGMANDPRMNPGGDGETIHTTDASGGQKTGHIRWVLGVGTVLAIAAMVLVWMLNH